MTRPTGMAVESGGGWHSHSRQHHPLQHGCEGVDGSVRQSQGPHPHHLGWAAVVPPPPPRRPTHCSPLLVGEGRVSSPQPPTSTVA